MNDPISGEPLTPVKFSDLSTYLYHGTSEVGSKAICQNGLVPSCKHGACNWKGNEFIGTRPQFTYFWNVPPRKDEKWAFAKAKGSAQAASAAALLRNMNQAVTNRNVMRTMDQLFLKDGRTNLVEHDGHTRVPPVFLDTSAARAAMRDGFRPFVCRVQKKALKGCDFYEDPELYNAVVTTCDVKPEDIECKPALRLRHEPDKYQRCGV